MDISLLKSLQQKGLLSQESFIKVEEQEKNKLFSVHWELKTILYLGILLFTSGLGILVYKNINSIGHQAVLAFIALVFIACFYYCFKNKLPFSYHKVLSPNVFFDYALLLGCISLLIFIAYFQYAYAIFGSRYGLATFIPMLALFFTAYYFDHLGVLSMAITNLAAWLGVTVTPLQLLHQNDFNSNSFIIAGVLLGLLLNCIAYFSERKNIKKHFAFTYINFGMHLLFISLLAALIKYDNLLMYSLIALLLTAFYFYKKSVADKSYYILLCTALYIYIALSYVVIHFLLIQNGDAMAMLYLTAFYFILSSVLLCIFLIKSNKRLKQHDSIQ